MKILLIGPSERIREVEKDYFKKKKEEKFVTLAYTGAITYLQEIDFTPDYYSFLDPLTIGSRIESFESDPYYNEIILLSLNFYEDDLSDFFKSGLTCNKLLRQKQAFDKFRSMNFVENFKEYITHKPKIVDLRNKKDYLRSQDFTNESVFYSGYKTINVDKFTCYLLPLIFKNFKNIMEVHCVGFGDFDVERVEKMSDIFSSGKKKDGYEHYKKTAEMVSPAIRFYLKNKKIKLTFEHDNFFSDLLA